MTVCIRWYAKKQQLHQLIDKMVVPRELKKVKWCVGNWLKLQNYHITINTHSLQLQRWRFRVCKHSHYMETLKNGSHVGSEFKNLLGCFSLTEICQPRGKGKYQSTNNTKIGIKMDNYYRKHEEASDENPLHFLSKRCPLLFLFIYIYIYIIVTV